MQAKCSAARRTGAPASCPPAIRARCSAAKARRFSIWRRRTPSATSSSAAGSICCSSLNRHFGEKRPEDTELEARLQLLRTGLPHAGGRAGSGGPHQGIGGHAQALRHGQRGHREVRHELPAGAPAGGARRPLRRALLRQRQRLGRAQRSRQEPRRGAARRPTCRSPAC